MSKYPYPGLRPFERDETDIFFGRDEQVNELLKKLEKSHFIAVVGPSGCGKSSLVRTGLVASLQGGLMPSAGGSWRVAELRPGDDPTASLAQALLRPDALGRLLMGEDPPDPQALQDAQALLEARLRRGPEALPKVVHEAQLPELDNFLLLVDQFEELFRFHHQVEFDEADAFVSQLLAVASSGSPRIYVILTMRSDYLGDCTRFRGLPEALNDNQYLTPRLTRAQAVEAITAPAEVFGGFVDPALCSELLNEYGGNPDQLPILQHVLMRMWTKAGGDKAPAEDSSEKVHLTLTHYRDVSGPRSPLDKHADDIYASLLEGVDPERGEERQRIAELVFRRLCEGGSRRRDTRRPTKLEDLIEVTGADRRDVEFVIEEFRRRGRSLLTPPQGTRLTPKTTIDIAHESLIRQWRRLTDWVEEEVLAAESYQALERAALIWEETKNPEDLPAGHVLNRALHWRRRGQFTADWAKRYGKNFELASDCLDEALKQRVEARSKQRAQRRRNRAIYAFVAGLAVVIVLLLTWNYRAELSRAEKAKRRHARDLVAAAKEMQSRDPGLAARLSTLAAVRDYTAASGGDRRIGAPVRRDIQELLMNSPQRGSLTGKRGVIRALALSPGGTRVGVATADRTGSIVSVWDRELGQPIMSISHGSQVRDLAFGEVDGGGLLVAMASDRSVVVWNVQTGDEITQLRGSRSLAFSGDGKELVVAGACLPTTYGTGDFAKRWPPDEKERSDCSGSEVTSVVFGRRNAEVVAGHADGRLLAYATDSEEGEPTDLTADSGPLFPPIRTIVGPANDRIATSDGEHEVKIWDLAGGSGIGEIKVEEELIRGLDISSDGQRVALATGDGAVAVWSTEASSSGKWEELSTSSQSHRGHAEDVLFEPNLDQVVSGGTEGTIRVTNAKSGAAIRRIELHNERLTSLTSSKDGTRLATVDIGGTIMVWDANTMHLKSTLSASHEGAIYSVSVDPTGGDLIATASGDSTAKLWRTNASSGELYSELVGTLEGHTDRVYDVTVGKGQLVATASKDGTARLWRISDCRTEESCAVAKGHTLEHGNRVYSVDFDKRGQFVATACADGVVRLWNIETGNMERSFKGHDDWVFDVEFSPDGAHLASASFDKTVRIWSKSSGKAVALPHPTFLEAIAYSSDGKLLATGDSDGVLRIWSSKSGKWIGRSLGNLGSRIYDLEFRPDGDAVAIALDDGRVALVNLDGRWTELRHSGKVFGLAFHPFLHELFTTTSEGGVFRWEVKAPWDLHRAGGVAPAVLRAPPYRAAALSSNGERLAVGGERGLLSIWDTSAATANPLVVRHDAHPRGEAVRAIAYHPMGSLIATLGRTVKIWALEVDESRESVDARLTEQKFSIGVPVDAWSIAFSPDGSRFLANLSDGTGMLWDVSASEVLQGTAQRLKKAQAQLSAATFSSANGDSEEASRLIVGWAKSDGVGEVGYYSFDSEEPKYLPLNKVSMKHSAPVRGIATSVGGERIATLGFDGKTVVWAWDPHTTRDATEIGELPQRGDPVLDVVLTESAGALGLNVFTGRGSFYRYPELRDIAQLSDEKVLGIAQSESRRLDGAECERYMATAHPITKEDEAAVNQAFSFQLGLECGRSTE